MNTIAVIINNKARNYSKANDYLQGLHDAEIMYDLYEPNPQELQKIIINCVETYKIILIGGGDGTIRTAAHHCMHRTVILGVLPLGTLNHFATELKLPINVNDLVTSLKVGKTSKIDLAKVNEYVFVNNSSIGFYPKFAQERDHYSKQYNKWLSYIPGFIESFKKHKSFEITIKGTNLDRSVHTSFLMISNNLYSYEFPLTIKRDSFQKALLGIYYFKQGRIRLLKFIKRLFNSRRLFEIDQSEGPIKIYFKHENKVHISLDGETTNISTPLHYEVIPASLTLLMHSTCE